eukprot:jgi/Botrbrau1/14631/Bobra.0364s0015.1
MSGDYLTLGHNPYPCTCGVRPKLAEARNSSQDTPRSWLLEVPTIHPFPNHSSQAFGRERSSSDTTAVSRAVGKETIRLAWRQRTPSSGQQGRRGAICDSLLPNSKAMELAALSSDVTADVGPLRGIPHALFRHIFPGLPLPLIMKLSQSSRDCRHAARAAIPIKLDAVVASVSAGCMFSTPEQLAVLMRFVERFTGADPVLMEPSCGTSFSVAPDGTITDEPGEGRGEPSLSVSLFSLEGDGIGERGWCLMIHSVLRGGDFCIFQFLYQWNSVMGRMACKAISLWIDDCEGVEDGQALLLLFQRAWQADHLQFWGPVKSPCQARLAGDGAKSASWLAFGVEFLGYLLGTALRYLLDGPTGI